MWHTVGAITLLGVMVFAVAYPLWLLGNGEFDEKVPYMTGNNAEPKKQDMEKIESKPVKTQQVKIDRQIDIVQLEQKIHEKVNQERQKHKIPLLRYDTKIADVAKKHSKDMAEKNYFSHIDQRNEGTMERYYRAGLKCIYFGENIYSTTMLQNNEDSIVVAKWMSSALHKRNILDPNYQSEGIGVYVSKSDEVFITQNFC